MLLKLNAITTAIRRQISLNMRQITCMHFEQISCFGDIYLDLVGILGICDISTGRNIHIWTWSRILLTHIYKYMGRYNTYLKDIILMLIKTKYNANICHNKLWRKKTLICETLTHFDPISRFCDLDLK